MSDARSDAPSARGGAPTPEALERLALRDAVIQAERAVVHWEAELARRVTRAQALDGLLPTVLDTLLGRREPRIEAAVAQVADGRTRLEAARRTLEDARQEHAAAEAAAEAAAQQRAQQERARDEAVARLRTSTHPLAAALDGVLVELDHHHSELDALRHALAAGAVLNASVGVLEVQLDRAAANPRGADLAFLATGRPPSPAARGEHALADLPDRIRQFEDACRAVGLDLRLSTDTRSGPSALGELLALAGGAWGPPLSLLQRAAALEGKLDGLLVETEATLRGLQARQDHVRAAIERLEVQRDAIVKQAMQG